MSGSRTPSHVVGSIPEPDTISLTTEEILSDSGGEEVVEVLRSRSEQRKIVEKEKARVSKQTAERAKRNKKATRRNKSFSYTFNNYTEAQLEVLRKLEGVSYHVIGREVCVRTGYVIAGSVCA